MLYHHQRNIAQGSSNKNILALSYIFNFFIDFCWIRFEIVLNHWGKEGVEDTLNTLGCLRILVAVTAGLFTLFFGFSLSLCSSIELMWVRKSNRKVCLSSAISHSSTAMK